MEEEAENDNVTVRSRGEQKRDRKKKKNLPGKRLQKRAKGGQKNRKESRGQARTNVG